MAKILLRANMGSPERPNIRTREIVGNISEKLLALFLASSTAELMGISNDIGVYGNPVFNETKKTAVIHYSIDDSIKLLNELRNRAIRTKDKKREWLTDLDTERNEIKLVLETGSEITFVKTEQNTSI